MKFNCAICGKECDRPAGHVNRSRKIGAPLFCGKACFGLSIRRKVPVTAEDLKERKRLYDLEYREKNLAEIRSRKSAYYAENHDREKEREVRKLRMPYHVEYCRRPDVKAKKHVYDVTRGAKERYGEFWECFLLSQQIHEAAVEKAGGKYELLLAKGYFDRSTTKRRRDYDRFDREEPEVGALGDLERRERW